MSLVDEDFAFRVGYSDFSTVMIVFEIGLNGLEIDLRLEIEYQDQILF